jgi:hypothetical protein
LSASASPALAPCGIPELAAAPPDELEVVVLELEVDGVEAAVEVDGLDVCGAAVDVCAAGVDGVVEELDEVEPQAATPTATSASKPGESRRIDLLFIAFMYRSSSCA